MYKIIGADGREYGPVTAEQLRQWIAEGRVNAQTRAQQEGSGEWKVLADFPEFAAVAGGYAQSSVEEFLTHDYSIGAGSCISRGWELVKANFWLLVGGTFLVMLVIGGLGAIPFLGGFVGLAVDGPLIGGIYWMYLRTIRGQQPSVGDGFAGFSRGFLQLMLVHVVTAILIGVAMLPGLGLIVGALVMSGVKNFRHLQGLLPMAIVFLLVGICACLVASFYLWVCWIFSLPLTIDKQMPFWDAMKLSMKMVRKHWWQVFWLLCLSGSVAMLGIFACCIGIFVTVPIAYASLMYAYEDIFGTLPATAG